MGSEPVEAIEDVRAGAGDMLPPPQALHPSTPINTRMTPRTEIFTGTASATYDCKGDAIAKLLYSNQLAAKNGTRFATVENVYHFFFEGLGNRKLQE